MNADEFKNLVKEIVRQELVNQSSFKIGTIASFDGKATIIFDGESQASLKKYTHASTYTPMVGDRVLLIKSMGTYMIIDKISSNITSNNLVVEDQLTLENDWVNYTGFKPATVYKTNDGMVHLSGLVRYGTNDTVITTLPLGCRPSQTEIFMVSTGTGYYGRVYVSSSGTVKIQDGYSAYVSLSGITFKGV